jgi:protease IV
LSSFKAVVYEKQPSVLELLTGLNVRDRTAFQPPDLAANLVPRLWYLAPTADAGLLANP